MNIKSFIKSIYFNDKELTSDDYAYSRKMFLFESATANALVAICGGAFLAGFNNYLGVSDEISGIIAGIPVIASVIQIFSSIIFEKIERKKFLICISFLLHRLLLSFMYLIPMMVTGTMNRIIIMLVMYITSSACASFAMTPVGAWIVDLAPTNMRGRYLGKKDAVSLIANTSIGLCMGWVLDIFRAIEKEGLGFIVVGLVVLLITIINIVFMSKAFEPPTQKISRKISLKDVLIEPIKDSSFRLVIGFTILYNISIHIALPYFAIYMVTGLKLEYGYITLMGIVSTSARVFFSKKWGKLADKTSWRNVTALSILALGFCHVLWIIINPSTVKIIFPLIQLLGGFCWAGVAISVFNLPFMYLPVEGRTMYLSCNSAYGGIAGFLSTIVGSTILSNLKNFNFKFFGLDVGNMQILFSISGFLLIICGLYIFIFMKTEKKAS